MNTLLRLSMTRKLWHFELTYISFHSPINLLCNGNHGAERDKHMNITLPVYLFSKRTENLLTAALDVFSVMHLYIDCPYCN